ncbi:MAG: hypothetical protein PHD97_08610 [Bacteroidales bacterium]|nr:hypothetical protein [Bacteroidales bacterium]
MSKKVPYLKNFDLVEKNETLSQFILCFSVVVSILTILIDKVNFFMYKDSVIVSLNSINCILAVIYFISDIVANYLFQIAEVKRRDDFFDNSLKTQLSEANSEGYFSNEHISYGILKMGVNCFENSFFSKMISAKMLKPMLFKSMFILILFLTLALFTDKQILSTALQMVLPYTIIQQTIRLFLYNKRMEDIFKHFQKIFSSTTTKQKGKLIIHNVTSYEALQAWACIKLDSKIFKKLNDELSIQWGKIKHKYCIT